MDLTYWGVKKFVCSSVDACMLVLNFVLDEVQAFIYHCLGIGLRIVEYLFKVTITVKCL